MGKKHRRIRAIKKRSRKIHSMPTHYSLGNIAHYEITLHEDACAIYEIEKWAARWKKLLPFT